MKKIILLIISIFGLYFSTYAQRTCGSELNIEQIKKSDTKRYQRIVEMEKFISQNISTDNQRIIDPNGTIVIPVVVHILHDGSAIGSLLNPSLARIQDQINVLTRDFRRTNNDRFSTPAVFQGVAADMNIEFRLACVDPSGNLTDGVTRRNVGSKIFVKQSSEVSTGIKYTNQGGTDAWNTSRYLNIWVCRVTSASGQGLLGYAQFPEDYSLKPNTDGVVISTTAFGIGLPLVSPYDRGRTATHEVGHWVGLRHIWGDDNGACSGSDQVNDTPNQGDLNFGCPSFPSISCNNTPNGDMFMNYMDYTDDNCMNLFTQGQRTRARALFMNGGVRSSFANGYFNLTEIPSSRTCNSITISLQNQSCLPVTWSVVNGTLSNQSNTQVTVTGNSNNVIVTASSGNYTDTRTLSLGQPAVIITSDIGKQFCKTYYYEFQNYIDLVGTGFAPLSANFQVENITNNFAFYVSQNKMFIQPHTAGFITFRVRVQGYCGWSPWKLLQYPVTNCSGGGFFKVYPNPAKESLTIDFDINKENDKNEDQKQESLGEVKIELYNSYQKLVFETTFKEEQKDRKLKIDTTKLPNGVYYLKLINKKEVYTERIVIEN